VQHREQHQRDRLAQVQRAAQVGRVKDLADVAQVGVDVGGPAIGRRGEQRPGVREHDGVVVHVHDPGLRAGLLRDLVHVGRGGDAGADVEEAA
jgi:hypothetical protein